MCLYMNRKWNLQNVGVVGVILPAFVIVECAIVRAVPPVPMTTSVVVINEPRTEQYFGSEVAAPVFKKIATDSLRILNVSPDNILDFQEKVSIEIENSKKYTFKKTFSASSGFKYSKFI